MGSPKKPRKTYSTPSHPWQSARIKEEKELVRQYGLKNKKEIWKMSSILKNFQIQAKRLIAEKSTQAEKEKKQLIDRLLKAGLIKTADLNAVLNITLKDVMDRRLQTIIFKRGLAKSIDQARQFIVHEHIFVGENKMTVPSYLVKSGEELTIAFDTNSKLATEAHPTRITSEKGKA